MHGWARSLFVILITGTYVIAALAGSWWPSPEVRAAAPTKPAASSWVHGAGYVDVEGDVRGLTFPRAGLVQSVHVVRGQRVERGARIATLDARVEAAELARAEARVFLAEARIAQLEAGVHPALIEEARKRVECCERRLEHAQLELRRVTKLHEKRVVPVDTLDKTALAVREREAELGEARQAARALNESVRASDRAVLTSELRVARSEVALIEARVAQAELVAPTKGRVLDVLVHAGETFSPLVDRPVVRFAAGAEECVRCEIDELDALRIKRGQPAVAYGVALGERELTGHVVRIKPLMGRKQTHTERSDERVDRGIREIWIGLDEAVQLPVGLRLDVRVGTGGLTTAPSASVNR